LIPATYVTRAVSVTASVGVTRWASLVVLAPKR
jgi:hypothetical protein